MRRARELLARPALWPVEAAELEHVAALCGLRLGWEWYDFGNTRWQPGRAPGAASGGAS